MLNSNKILSNNQKSYLDLRGFSTLVSRHIVRSDFIVFSDISTEDQNTIIYNGDEVLTQALLNFDAHKEQIEPAWWLRVLSKK